jgi:hypothetical protein
MKNGWFAVLAVTGVAAVLTPAIVLAANVQGFGRGQGFNAVVDGIEIRYHAHPTTIPFMGLISGIAGLSTHGGVRNMHVAEFEDMKEPVDGAELKELVEKHVGQNWHRMVRETSKHGGDQSLIYVRDEGQHMGMLVVDLDGSELDVVQISVNPDQLVKELGKHDRHHDRETNGNSGETEKQSGESE